MYIRYPLILLTVLLFGSPAFGLSSADSLTTGISKSWTGDFSAMKKDKVVRVLMPYSITSYYIDNGQEKGVVVEYMRKFEAFLNKGIKKELDKIRIIFVPTRRNKLISSLVEGQGDIAAAELTITPERLENVDFSDPILSNVREVLVTSKDVADISALGDLAKMKIHVRESSSYYSSLLRINEELEKQSLSAIEIITTDEKFEDEDLLEMVQSGMVPAIIIDEYSVKPWLKVHDKIKIHGKIAISEGGNIGWAFRKNSPEFKKVINQFISKNRAGTVFGNIMLKRYYSDINKIINPKSETYQKKLTELVELFNKYGKKYNIDPMLLAAQAFQESKFNQKAKSRVGAVGIMQVLPSTAKDRNVNIKNIHVLENNIEAGAKYMRFVADHYFNDDNIPEFDKILFVFASYNAGPNRVARVRKKANDPNSWFDSVDWQVARAAGSEPIKYVKNIYIYYIAFKKISDEWD
jgi:membrane-bound lytic murein transglycosylase MltF